MVDLRVKFHGRRRQVADLCSRPCTEALSESQARVPRPVWRSDPRNPPRMCAGAPELMVNAHDIVEQTCKASGRASEATVGSSFWDGHGHEHLLQEFQPKASTACLRITRTASSQTPLAFRERHMRAGLGFLVESYCQLAWQEPPHG